MALKLTFVKCKENFPGIASDGSLVENNLNCCIGRALGSHDCLCTSASRPVFTLAFMCKLDFSG